MARLAALCPAKEDPELCEAVKKFDGEFTPDSLGAAPYLLLLDALAYELVLSLGPEHWPRTFMSARLHREAMGALLPPKVRARARKTVFSGAVGRLLKNAAPALDALFHQGEWFSADYVARDEARALLRRAFSAPDDRWRDYEVDWRQVRAIATLETWLRIVFGYASPGASSGHD